MRGLSLTDFKRSAHPADIYCRQAAAGELVVSKWVRLAALRHIDDLREGHKRGLWFDPEAGQVVLDFFSFCKHSKGEWAGQPVSLEPWQQFIFYVFFGWKNPDGLRRFRTAHVEVARKNGKSTLCAGLALYLLVADGELGAEVYAAATKKDQARIVFDEAAKMRKASPEIAKYVAAFRDNLSMAATNSKFQPLGSDEDTLDGLNMSGGIVDELHAHKTRAVWDVLQTARGARRQPVTFAITTAGFNKYTVCWEQHDYGEKILEGIQLDDTLFVYIACIDEGDDWTDERNWPKANPNLNVSVKLENLREEANIAKNSPRALNSFLRLRLNRWTEGETRWLKPDAWKACVGASLKGTDAWALRTKTLEELAGRRMFAGLDLSSKIDLSCYMRVFPPTEDDPRWILIPNFYMPADNVARRVEEDRVQYDLWIREKFIEETPGTVIDYKFIERDILEDASQFEIIEIAFDPWNATSTSTNLQGEGLTLVEFRQGFGSMSGPAKDFEAFVLKGTIAHLANPVLRWQASNVVVEMDAAGNIKPSKKKSSEKIDGIVAAVMGIGRALASPDGGSVYDTEGILTL